MDLSSTHCLQLMTIYGYVGEGLSERQTTLLRAMGEQATESEQKAWG